MEKTGTKNTIEKIKKGAGKSLSVVKDNPKTAMYVVGGAIGVYLLYRLVKGLGNSLDLSTDPNAGGNAIDVNDPSFVPTGGTMTNAQAQTAAATLMDAMHTWGQVNRAEFNRIKEVFAGRNAVDYNTISKAFGQPRRSIFTGEGSIAILGGEKLGLSQWLVSEIRPDWINELRQTIPGVF
jgi:hypothetical protein